MPVVPAIGVKLVQARLGLPLLRQRAAVLQDVAGRRRDPPLGSGDRQAVDQWLHDDVLRFVVQLGIRGLKAFDLLSLFQ